MAAILSQLEEQEERLCSSSPTIDNEGSSTSNNEEVSSASIILPASTATKLAIYFHPACELHCIGGHPEQPMRVKGILSELRKRWPEDTFRQVKNKATDEHLLLFHTKHHVELFSNMCKKVESGGKEYVTFDGDTQVMAKTRDAAYYAVGAIIEAIDSVFLPPDDPQYITTAFCNVRPPGHHAEPNKAMGFCFFSNAAIGAKYAQDKYGVDRVAVLDFDVHHGNGTEEGFKSFENLFYGSTHEKDNFPGTGKDPSPKVGDLAVLDIHRRIVNRYLITGQRQSTQQQFRIKWRQVVREMERFKPELILFSAGFDAHDADPLADCELTEEDFAWATEIVLDACTRINSVRPPPCLSILEGGYDIEALGLSVVAHVDALAKGYPTPAKKGDEVAALASFLEEIGLDAKLPQEKPDMST